MTEPGISCESLLEQARSRIPGETPQLDAELLLAHVTGWTRSRFRAFPETPVDPTQIDQFSALVKRRAAGEPIAYILGEQEFWSLPLTVGTSTLIPRPDTECLVEAALALSLPKAARVLDLGTGTGAIALALASEKSQWAVYASDRAPEAVTLAKRNAERLNLPVEFRTGSWFSPWALELFDLIVSNPPYVAEDDIHLDQGDVRFEPRSALASGPDGLDDLQYLIKGAPTFLSWGGWLVTEHGYDQGEAVRALFHRAGFEAVRSGRDYGGNERFTLGCWRSLPEED